MSRPVKLATPYPTMEDAAEVYGISSSRLQRLKKMLQGLLKGGEGKTKPKVHLSRKANGAATRPRTSLSSHHAKTRKRTAKSK